MAINFDYDELRNDVEKEIIKEFNCRISEIMDIWDLYEGSSYIDLHLILDEAIKKLRDVGIMVLEKMKLCT